MNQFLNQTGIKDNSTGQYIISLPSWSRTVYYNGTRIEYSHDANLYADEIKLDGPITAPLRVVVSLDSVPVILKNARVFLILFHQRDRVTLSQ